MSRFTGAVLLIAGTTIGAGTLALPMAVAELGFMWASVAIIAMWGLMYYTSLLTLELNLAYGSGQSLGHLADWLMGKPAKVFTSITLAYLFYALLAAYITGGASMLKTLCSYFLEQEIAVSGIMVVFTVILVLMITLTTKILDYSNRVFFALKMVFFAGMVLMLWGQTNSGNLNQAPYNVFYSMPLALPVIFTSFGFHGSIPSLVNFCEQDPKLLKNALLWGSLLPVALYVIWLGITIGVLPISELALVEQQGFNVGDFIKLLGERAHIAQVQVASWGFALLAIVTSFLGVGWGLFDFFRERTVAVKCPKLAAVLLTFLLPLLIAGFYPQAFIGALGFAAIALSVLGVILPVVLVLRLRSQMKAKSYQAPGGVVTLGLIALVGVSIIALEVISLFR